MTSQNSPTVERARSALIEELVVDEERRQHLAFYTQAVRLLTGGAIEGKTA